MLSWSEMGAHQSLYEDRRREAARERLARMARADRQAKGPLYAPLLAGLGRHIAALGCALQDRYGAMD